MFRIAGTLLLAAAVASTAPTALATAPTATTGASAAAPADGSGGVRAAADHDEVVPASQDSRLLLPAALRPTSARSGLKSGRARFRYAISVVAIPVSGMRLGASEAGMAAMVDRAGRRMADQTDGLVGYRLKSWTRAPKTTNKALPCDVERIHEEYGRYAKGLRRTPPGYRDTIAIYVSPMRMKCAFSGSALLGGDGTYLNGVDLRDPQHIQDWVTAHEIGHNFTLVHSGAFFASERGWSIDTSPVPKNRDSQKVAEYGDYLDIMGSPPRSGYNISGADFARWTLDSVSQLNLGVMDDRDVEVVEKAGTFDLQALKPGGSREGPSVLAIPIVADRTATFWMLEYRPIESNAAGVDYPEPWSTSGYGVRLIEYEHVSHRWYNINKVLRLQPRAAAPAVLPVWQRIRLGGGGTVGVVAGDPGSATVTVTVPGGAASRRYEVPWRGR